GISPVIPTYILPRSDWGRLSQDETPEGAMAVVRRPAQPTMQDVLTRRKEHLLLLHEVSNPNNLGAVLRTARWFGFQMVAISEGSVDVTHPKVVRTAMGSLFYLDVLDGVDFIKILPDVAKYCQLIGTDPRGGIPPHGCTRRTALVFGSESHGLPEKLLEMTTERWCIPGGEKTDSLSLPQAAAIMMYACMKTDAH
ncbi:MAG: RNA methyltransferase, partial [Syntrophales bacterium]